MHLPLLVVLLLSPPANLHVIPAPPERNSAAERADLARVREVQQSASAADRRRALTITDAKLGTLFGPPFGPLTDAEVQRWSPAFARVAKDVEQEVGALKNHFKRPRPYVVDPRVASLAKRDAGFSYPSGSATVAQAFAQLLARLEPARRAKFLARAAEIGQDRIVVGAHHPTDIQAGVTLGDHLAGRLWDSYFSAPGAASGSPSRGP